MIKVQINRALVLRDTKQIAERAALRSALKMIRVFQDETMAPTLPTQLVASFLVVALNEGKSLREYTELMGQKQSTLSRHLLDLSERGTTRAGFRPEGYGLIDSRQDPNELRKNIYTLTKKGRDLVAKLTVELAS